LNQLLKNFFYYNNEKTRGLLILNFGRYYAAGRRSEQQKQAGKQEKINCFLVKIKEKYNDWQI